MSDQPAIKVSAVSKDFTLPHLKANSLKSVFTGFYKRNITGSHETQHALKDINIDIKQGEFFGIVGRNGSGKSTLLKILAGIYQPSHGSVETRGKLVPFIELGVGFNPELTGRENVYLNGAMLGFSEQQISSMYKDIVDFAELERFMDQKLKNYSSGMQVRLAFSMATRANADVLLVDEVLAVGDADFQRKCFEYFKELKVKKKTVVFVTHDMSAVREYCDRAMLIEKSHIVTIGSPDKVAREYSLLFMENKFGGTNGDGKRWGNKAANIEDVKVTQKNDLITVSVTTLINEPIDKLIYGLHISGQDGAEITAMNNRMIQVEDVKAPLVGSLVRFDWQILNVFNDGKYFITLTLVDDIANTLDWYVGAASFTVKRPERSTTPVLPPVKVTHTVVKELKK